MQDGGGIIAGGKHVEHMLDGKAPTANDRLAAKYLWIEGDAFKE